MSEIAPNPLPWLLLIPQLPAKPAILRVKVSRRLQLFGAAPVENEVYALPLRDETRVLFEELQRDIVAGRGEAIILEARLAGGRSDIELCAIFDAARDADYDELVRDARLLTDAGELSGSDLASFHKRLNKIAAIDFFSDHGGQAAQVALTEVKQRAHDSPDMRGKGAPDRWVRRRTRPWPRAYRKFWR